MPRRRLLAVKLAAGLILAAGAIAVLVIASYLIGLLAFGAGPLTTPNGGNFGDASAIGRIAIIAGYLFVSLLFTAGIAFLMSVLTDVPLGAVGAAVVIVIVLNILDAIDALGDLRRLLPTDYGNAWVDALGPTIVWDQMAIGASYSIVTFAVLVTIAVLRFDRKDITS